MSTTICLHMLVRYHEPGIKRCLESVRHLIDCWVIIDAGMSEQTRNVIQTTLKGLPGKIQSVDFQHYAQCRNQGLQIAKESADYLLLLEPDMRLSECEVSDFGDLIADGYFIQVGKAVQRKELRLINNQQEWQYFGASKEILRGKNAKQFEHVKEAWLEQYTLAENLEFENQEAFETLSILVEEFPDDAHAVFNLAKLQLHKKNWQSALQLFDHYLQLEDQLDLEWHWYALYSRAKLLEQSNVEPHKIIQGYLLAYEIRPIRAESLYELARYYRASGNSNLAQIYIEKAFKTALPRDELYDLHLKTYEWHIPAEYSLICLSNELHSEAILGANLALRSTDININTRNSLIASRQRSVDVVNGKKIEFNDVIPKSNYANRLRLVVPFRNAAPWLPDCIESIKNQNYENFTATFIDDCSDDGSAALIPVSDPRFELISNSERKWALINRMDFIFDCDESDIVVYLDGDDQLAADNSLSYLNDIYNELDCWITYGQYMSQRGNFGFAEPFCSEQAMMTCLDQAEMRYPIHLITHRAGLLHRYREFDPELKGFKDDKGEWFSYASDVVLTRPLFYMAGFSRTHYCNRAVCLYTEAHEISDAVIDNPAQIKTCRALTQRIRPPKVTSYLQLQ